LRDAAEKENAQRPTPNAQRPAEKNSGFEDALDDDLNISAALGLLFETIRETNRAMDQNKLEAASANEWLNWWNHINNVLGLEPEEKSTSAVVTVGGLEMKGALGTVHIKGDPLPAEVAKLAEARAQARLAKDWRKSDELRDELMARGWEARDTKDGQKITKRSGS
jgi:cysteinyl-tRNA synthetase